MTVELSAAQRRLAALVLAAAFAGVGYAALVQPLIAAHGYFNERIADLKHRLSQYSKAAKSRDSAERQLEQRKRADLARHYYLGERNPALAAAELQALLKRALEQAKGELVSTQVLSGQRPGEITVRAQVRGDIRAVQRILHALEGARPILFVSSVSVSAAAATRAPRAPAVPAAKDLLVNFDLTGHTRERAL
jgi:general secretion pathway protein M